MSKVYDIAILGANPAGYAAAHYLAKHRRKVVLIDPPQAACECPLTDWAPHGFFQTAGLPKSLAKAAGAVPFAKVCYHNVHMDKEVSYGTRKALGTFIQRDQLCKALRAACEKAGVKPHTTKTAPTIQLREDNVRLVGTVQVTAKLLMVTHSRPTDVLAELAIPARATPQSHLVAAGLDIPVSDKDFESLNDSMHILEMSERSEMGLFFATKGMVHLRVISDSLAAGNRASELSEMVAKLQHADVLPSGLQLGRAKGAIWRPPAGIALEMENHVAKRCLLAGTAGGFADSVTGQTLQPSVQSALLAAEAALEALRVSHGVQETLMHFKNAWRKHLADAIRPPNTSLRLLLPLLFVNENIVDKFTKALLYGESI